MAKVTVYMRDHCGYSTRAIQLLEAKNVEMTVHNAGADPKLREEMLARSNGGTTYPQIFIGNEHVGGYDDVYALDRKGALDAMLA